MRFVSGNTDWIAHSATFFVELTRVFDHCSTHDMLSSMCSQNRNTHSTRLSNWQMYVGVGREDRQLRSRLTRGVSATHKGRLPMRSARNATDRH